jgi:colanic acid/amylovoran biosynthesis glycosyltransferase
LREEAEPVGTTCIIGVDDDKVLKDFIRAHVDYLRGEKVLVDHWYPDFKHQGRTIRYFHTRKPTRRKLRKLLPHFVYSRFVTTGEQSFDSVHDALAGFLREFKVDVVLAEFGPAGADIAPHLRPLGIPLIVHFHGHDAHRKAVVEQYRQKYEVMFDIASRIISVSRFMSETLISLGADPKKIVLNPYGPREEFFSVDPDYRPTVLSLGRFTDIKANYLTLASFAKAAQRIAEARLVMVGTGELLETCKTLARIWKIEDKVTFTGAVPHSEILPFFAEACCFAQHSVIPSYGDAEGTPVAVLEAGAAGLPVVATRHAGIPDVVNHGETGFLVEEGDVEGMGAFMGHLLNDADLARRMGKDARQRIRAHFSLDRHISVLQRVLDDARSSH